MCIIYRICINLCIMLFSITYHYIADFYAFMVNLKTQKHLEYIYTQKYKKYLK